MDERDEIRLRHNEALSFLHGRTSENLRSERMLLLALVKEIEIIGEAAGRISVETQNTLAGIPWPKVISMRNRLIHAYADVNLAIIWETVTEALPVLVTELEKVLPPLPPDLF
jgi:uncharacterized protein with HEPN domain